ncbi:type II secretion system protein [Candidatus Saccharibacteria bacterium]|nr:type II secretion system protein [Candidatus Saccharibacteria bacterium]
MKKTIKSKEGFTLIEVTLFLAISGFLVTALIAGTSATIARQRYNDSVQNFTSFLKTAYSDVIHVENQQRGSSGGNDSTAIYGKLINFADDGTITTYTIIGEAVHEFESSKSVLESLEDIGAKVAGEDDTYIPTYSARIQDTKGDTFAGRILIVRSPISGSVKTYYSDNGTPCNINNIDTDDNCKIMKAGWNGKKDINFCIDSDDSYAYGGNRRNIRIITKDGFNASAVQLIDYDGGDNKC